MHRHNPIVIGASAGGIDALTRVVRGLGSDIPAAVLVTLHISDQSVLPAILDREGTLPVSHARDGEPLERGHIYCAPPGQHLLVDRGHVRLSHGPRENGHRPAVDPLFRSAARAYRDGAVGVILSGQLDDGAAGLYAIKARGGLTVVQDPTDAAAPSMPRNALRYVDVDYCATADDIGPLLVALAKGGEDMAKAKQRRSPKPSSRSKANAKKMIGSMRRNRIGTEHRAHPPANAEEDPLRCPSCAGPLYRVQNGHLTQWRCREGHVFSPESLNGAQSDALERALWVAVRTMKERALIDRTLSERLHETQSTTRGRLTERAQATERDVELLREILDRI